MPGDSVVEAEGQTSAEQSAVPLRSRYLTRSATRKGTANISHILQRAPATTRASRTTKTTPDVPASSNAQPKTRTPFIEALNRVASSSGTSGGEASSSRPDPAHHGSPNNASPAKPLPQNRKRPSGGMHSSPRGVENSPNTRPRKVARMPRIVGVGPSPLKPLAKYPTMRSDALFGPQVAKVESNIAAAPQITKAPITTAGNTASAVKPNLFSPAKVPVGSQTPFRYGTNRILDVPLSAVKKGGRWSLASDLSDDSLLLAASPKRPAERPKTSLSNISPEQLGKADGEHSTSMDETAKDMELLFLREESADDIQVGGMIENPVEVTQPTKIPAKSSTEKPRKTMLQKTSAARIVHRAQKSLSLPRTTSSYANPTRSSTNAASITAAAIDARTSLKNAIREPIRKPLLTPAMQIAAPPPASFARPCGVQSRPSTMPSSTLSSIPQGSSVSSSQPSRQSTTQSAVKPRSYIPISPVRERNANVPNESHKANLQSDTIGLGRPTSHTNHARRKSLTMETSKSLYGLSAALAKLTVKRPSLEGRSPDIESTSFAPQQTISGAARSDSTNQSATLQPSKPVAISRIPQSSSVHARSSLAGMLAGRGSLDVMGTSLGQSVTSSLKGTHPLSSTSDGDILKGVTAYVDVRTAEGDDTSAVFAEMLRSCGARVSKSMIRSLLGTKCHLSGVDKTDRKLHAYHLQVGQNIDSHLVEEAARAETAYRRNRMGHAV